METEFKKIRIYKIVPKNGAPEMYIGSTETPLSHRFSRHLYSYLYYKNKCSCAEIFDKYGVDNCEIKLIAEHNVANNEEKYKWERLYYELHKEVCINKNRPYVSEEEKKKQVRELQKSWYNKNKDYKKCKSLLRYYKNKDETTNCPHCNKEVKTISLKSHLKSMKCKNYNIDI